MSAPRGLSAEEAAAWAEVARTVRPLSPVRHAQVDQLQEREPAPAKPKPSAAIEVPPPSRQRVDGRRASGIPARPARDDRGLDSHWDRRFRAGTIEPDFTLDLHGHTLGSAHTRLDAGLAQAKALGARVVLVIAGKPRPVDAADRGSQRGAIRAKLLDWLAAGPHGADIAAIRNAHRRHGGDGALYLVLKRRG